MSFRTPPHPDPRLFSNHITSWRDMSGIFKITELYSLTCDVNIVILPVDENIVRLNVYPSVAAQPSTKG
jgi:hypothetical protein